MFARRGFNVQSLAVGTSETEGRSRITMVVPGGSDSLQNLIKQVRLDFLVHLLGGRWFLRQIPCDLAVWMQSLLCWPLRAKHYVCSS